MIGVVEREQFQLCDDASSQLFNFGLECVDKKSGDLFHAL